MTKSLIQKLKVDNAGNVGIGTTTPVYKLDVSGNINFTGNLYNNGVFFAGSSGSQWNDNGSNIYFSTGNVGVGISNPRSTLDVNGILLSKKIGIGSVSPSKELDVSGNINFSGDLYKNGVLFTSGGGSSQWTTTGSNIYYNTGNVGIGSLTPAYKLDVSGNLNFSGDIYKNGVLFTTSSQWTTSGSTIYHNSGNVGIGTTNIPSYTVLTPSDGVQEIYYGSYISMSDDGTKIAVAPYIPYLVGYVFVHEWNGVSWTETKLAPSDGAVGEAFGYDIAISNDGDTVAVTAYVEDTPPLTNNGAVYVFKRNGNSWLETKLVASDISNNDTLGSSVAVSADGNAIVSGASAQNLSQGSAYIFKWNGVAWAQTKLTASDGVANDNFGNSVSMSADGNAVVVGAPYASSGGFTQNGGIYVYKWNGTSWVETKLVVTNQSNYEFYGLSVSMAGDGNTIAVGSLYADTGNVSNHGAVYVFKWNGSSWVETKITASDKGYNEQMGNIARISRDGNVIVAADFNESSGTTISQGAAYVFRWNGSTWLETKITSKNPKSYRYFGNSVATSSNGDIIAISEINADVSGNANQGVVYLYNFKTPLFVNGNLSVHTGLFNDGSQSLPSLSFNTDSNTGLYHPETGILGFVTRSNEAMRIDGSGNIGIGTNFTLAKAHIYYTGTGDILRVDDKANDNTPFIIKDTGNVGIGSLTPAYNLDVSGNLNLTGDIYKNGVLFTSGGGGSSQWTTSGSTIYYNTGNVGIGSLAPAYKLDVSGNLNFTGDIYKNGALFTTSSQWSTSGSTISYNTGNVGIGSLAPAYQLDVSGNAKATRFISTQTSGTAPFTVASTSLVTNLNADLLDGLDSSYFRNAANINAGTLSVSTGGTGATSLTANKVLVGNGTSTILQPTNLHWDNTNSRLGIGITSPVYALDVTSNTMPVRILNSATTGSQGCVLNCTSNNNKDVGFSFECINLTSFGIVLRGSAYGRLSFVSNYYPGSNGSEVMCLTQNNTTPESTNVGINKTNPSAALDVSGNIYMNDGTAAAPILAFSSDTNTGIYRPSADTLGFSTGGVQRLTINSSGNVGIGVTSPAYKLDVAGNINFTGNLYQNGVLFTSGGGGSSQWTTSGSDIYYNTGNVGIGNPSPVAKLDVSGNIFPSVSDVHNLGSSTKKWNNIFVAGEIDISASNVLYPTTTKLQSNGFDFVVFDDTNLNGIPYIPPYIVGTAFSHSNSEPSIFIPSNTSTYESNYISFPYGSPCAINNIFDSDMTIEAFVYFATSINDQGWITANVVGCVDPTGGYNTNTGVWAFGMSSTRQLQFVYANTTNNIFRVNSSSYLSLNTWYHVAVTYTASTKAIRLYINGTLQTLAAPDGTSGGGGHVAGDSLSTTQGTLRSGTYPLIVGMMHRQSLGGYISNLRIVYGSVITPGATPTAPLSSVTNTKLLLKTRVTAVPLLNVNTNRVGLGVSEPHSEFHISETPASAIATNIPGTGYSTTGNVNDLVVVSSCGLEYSDITGKGIVGTTYGSTLFPSNFSPGGNAFSVYINGIGIVENNYEVTNNITLGFNFTIDAFVYYTAVPANASQNLPYLIGRLDWGGTNYSWSFGMNNNSKLAFGFQDTNSVTYLVDTSNNMSINTWYHIAVTYQLATGDLRLYINGALQTLTNGSTSYNVGTKRIKSISYPLVFGSFGGQYIRAYVCDLRVLNTFTTPPLVPTAPQTIPSSSSTLLLLRTVANARGSTIMNVKKNGNVGIGTTLPQARFDVYDGYISGVYTNAVPHMSFSSVANTNPFYTWLQRSTSVLSQSWWSSASTALYHTITGPPGSAAFAGGVLVPDGRVIFVPLSSTTFGIFNPQTNTYSTVSGAPGNAAYLGGVLAPDGRVIFVPYNATTIGIFTPSTNAYTTVSGAPGSGAYSGGVLLPDGRILFVPRNATTFGIFTPSTNAYSTISGAPGNNAFSGGVLLPDGRVILVPYNSTNIGIFNSNNNTYSTVSGAPGSSAYNGGVLLPDGRVLFIPYNNATIGIFNTTTNTFSTIAFNVNLYSGGFAGGVLLPDGRVVFIPYNAINFVYFNYTTNTFTSPVVNLPLYAFWGGTLLPDGRVLVVPHYSTSIYIISGFPRPPIEMCYHPCFNKL